MIDILISVLVDSFLVGVGVVFILALPFTFLMVLVELPIMANKKMESYFDRKTEQINEWTEKKQRENQRSS